jgi:hypothetical protein
VLRRIFQQREEKESGGFKNHTVPEILLGRNW